MWGSRGVAPIFFTSALDGGELVASGPCRFSHQEMSPRYSLVMRLGGPQNLVGSYGENKNCSVRNNFEFHSVSHVFLTSQR